MGNRPVVLIAESNGFPEDAKTVLEETAEVRLEDLDREALFAELPEAHILWVRLRHEIDDELLDRATRLRLLATPTTGLNHISTESVQKRGIEVISLRGETDFLRNIRATAEHTLALILALIRRVPSAADHVLKGGWNRDLFRGREVYRRTVGVVGYGRLGRIVSRYLDAMGATVLTTDPSIEPSSVEPGAVWVEPSELLARSEIVTIHVNFDEANRGIFDASWFEQLRPGAFLINTSRGELFDEEALLQSLNSNQLGGAALDVLIGEKVEGMANHPLVQWARGHDNLIITPHIGGNTYDSLASVESWLARRVATRIRSERYCW